MFLKSGDQIGLVSAGSEALFLQELFKLGNLESGVVGHFGVGCWRYACEASVASWQQFLHGFLVERSLFEGEVGEAKEEAGWLAGFGCLMMRWHKGRERAKDIKTMDAALSRPSSRSKAE